MSNRIDPKSHIGETHGIYTLTDVSETKDKYGHYTYTGVCNNCGYIKYSHYGDFSGEKSKTVVCNHIDVDGEYIRPTSWDNKRIGKIFKDMKARCYNPNDKSYCWYGEKGIKICDEWIKNPKSFETWSLNNGYSNVLTIDRIDENKGYSPTNCRWITSEDNSKYKSTTLLITVNDEIHTGKDWSRILGFGENTINKYIRTYGLDNTAQFIEKYLANPNKKPKHKQSYYDLYMTIQN